MTLDSSYNFRASFAEEVSLPEGELDLQRAALYLAGEEYPDLDPGHYLRRMDDMAAEVRSLAENSEELEGLARALNSYLFDIKGFSGNTGNYYDPDNSFLNRVMETGIGIPITLSVLYLGVAKRLGLNGHAVGMPGHFLVKLEELDLYWTPSTTDSFFRQGTAGGLPSTCSGQGWNGTSGFYRPHRPSRPSRECSTTSG